MALVILTPINGPLNMTKRLSEILRSLSIIRNKELHGDGTNLAKLVHIKTTVTSTGNLIRF